MSEIDTKKYNYYWHDTKIKEIKECGDQLKLYYDVKTSYYIKIKKHRFPKIISSRLRIFDHSESSDETGKVFTLSESSDESDTELSIHSESSDKDDDEKSDEK